ncbi:MAG: sigma-70 family RNA polymerase sigma factor [Saprospiraceae bacterium]|nr:sigma-70 family RNA polymerase sigma factor [Saprospiraceae bacterium]
MDNSIFIQLLARCQANDRLSQTQLYRMFYNYGMTVASRYAPNRDDATEILNDAFVRTMQNLDKFNRELSFKAWFNKILVRCAINYYRRYTIKRLDAQPITESDDQPFDAEILSGLSAQDIMKLVQQLPQSYRLAFNMYAIEGYSHPEIAEMQGISEGTSKSNLFKARKRLMEMIKGEGEDEESDDIRPLSIKRVQ